jgi:hypothetical protein
LTLSRESAWTGAISAYFRICSGPFLFSRTKFFKDRPRTQPLFDHFHSVGKPYSRLVAQHPSRFLDTKNIPEQQPQPGDFSGIAE